MELHRATVQDAERICRMQQDAFAELLERYQDYDTSPACENQERIEAKLCQAHTYFYFIREAGETVGAIRIVDKKDGSRKRIAPVFILAEYRGRGLAQTAIREAERIHGGHHWKLDTILQEAGNCYLYEKLGYHRTGQLEQINERMTIVYYEKD